MWQISLNMFSHESIRSLQREKSHKLGSWLATCRQLFCHVSPAERAPTVKHGSPPESPVCFSCFVDRECYSSTQMLGLIQIKPGTVRVCVEDQIVETFCPSATTSVIIISLVALQWTDALRSIDLSSYQRMDPII